WWGCRTPSVRSIRPVAEAHPMAPRMSQGPRTIRRWRTMRRHSPRRSAAGWLRWRQNCARTDKGRLFPQYRPDEGHGQAALGDQGGLIQCIQQFIERTHVPRKAPLQPARGFLRKLDAAHAGSQLEGLALLGLIQDPQLKD